MSTSPTSGRMSSCVSSPTWATNAGWPHWAAVQALAHAPPIMTVVSDLVTVHRGWVDPGTESYLLPTQEAAESLRRQGVPAERLVHVGFPIRSALFCRSGEMVRTHTAGERLRVLVMGGTSGSGRIRADVKALLRSGLPLDLTRCLRPEPEPRAPARGVRRNPTCVCWATPTYAWPHALGRCRCSASPAPARF